MRTLPLLTAALVAVAACSPSAQPSPSAPPEFGFRAWTSQVLPPPASFTTGPVLAIADDVVITPGAVPAIYPGPLVAPLVARRISTTGIAAIVREMQAAGLLADRTDFTDGRPPGGVTGNIVVTFDGAQRELVGDPMRTIQCVTTPCVPPPGTAEAFATFWNRLYDLGGWLGPELGAEGPYEPTRAAVLVTDPTIDPALPGNVVEWPLGALREFGQPYAAPPGARCGLVEGDELLILRPVLSGATQLTRFRDPSGAERGLVVRWLTPGEPDPCSG